MSSALKSELLANEVVLWSGAPARGLRFGRWSSGLAGLALLVTVLAWNLMVLSSSDELPLKLFGIPLSLFALHVGVGRFLLDAKRRAATVYAITDRRVLIIVQLFGRQVTSLVRARLGELHLDSHRSGHATLTFGPVHTGKDQPASPAFEYLDDARAPFEILNGSEAAPYR